MTEADVVLELVKRLYRRPLQAFDAILLAANLDAEASIASLFGKRWKGSPRARQQRDLLARGLVADRLGSAQLPGSNPLIPTQIASRLHGFELRSLDGRVRFRPLKSNPDFESWPSRQARESFLCQPGLSAEVDQERMQAQGLRSVLPSEVRIVLRETTLEVADTGATRPALQLALPRGYSVRAHEVTYYWKALLPTAGSKTWHLEQQGQIPFSMAVPGDLDDVIRPATSPDHQLPMYEQVPASAQQTASTQEGPEQGAAGQTGA
jgi:hypothetical protein